MEVEILSEPVVRTIQPKNGNSSFNKSEYEAVLFDGICEYPLHFTLSVGDGVPPMKAGERYRVGIASFKVGDFGNLQIKPAGLKLVSGDVLELRKAS